jgi:hypothetical protein
MTPLIVLKEKYAPIFKLHWRVSGWIWGRVTMLSFVHRDMLTRRLWNRRISLGLPDDLTNP